MNKTQFIDSLADRLDCSKAEGGRILDAVLETFEEGLVQFDGVTIVGWGALKKVRREAREGRNPRTGEKIQIKAANQVKFSAGSKLKEAVN